MQPVTAYLRVAIRVNPIVTYFFVVMLISLCSAISSSLYSSLPLTPSTSKFLTSYALL